MTDNEMAKLLIPRDDLLKLSRILLKANRPKRGEQAILSYDGACLHIELGGATVAIPASGSWPGQARVLGAFIRSIARLPPEEDPIAFTDKNANLTIGRTSVKCAWQAPWTANIEMPINATLVDYLALRHHHTNGEIMTAVLPVIYEYSEEPVAARPSGDSRILIAMATASQHD